MDIRKESLKMHYQWRGKFEIASRIKIKGKEDLCLAYTPGVAEPCLYIKDDYEKSFCFIYIFLRCNAHDGFKITVKASC